MPRIFILGVSGCIGGTATATIRQKYVGKCNFVALVRQEWQAETVRATWPEFEILIGDLDSLDLIKKESEKAHIVLAIASADHPASTRAILQGLSANKTRTGYLIHTSGSLLVLDVTNGWGGPPNGKVWSD